MCLSAKCRSAKCHGTPSTQVTCAWKKGIEGKRAKFSSWWFISWWILCQTCQTYCSTSWHTVPSFGYPHISDNLIDWLANQSVGKFCRCVDKSISLIICKSMRWEFICWQANQLISISVDWSVSQSDKLINWTDNESNYWPASQITWTIN